MQLQDYLTADKKSYIDELELQITSQVLICYLEVIFIFTVILLFKGQFQSVTLDSLVKQYLHLFK